MVEQNIKKRINTSYGFVPDKTLTTHCNARQILGNMPITTYLGHPTNLAFHDRTTNNHPPIGAHQLLGLGLKFVPTPKQNITVDEIDTCLSRLDRDLGLKVYFAGDLTNDGTNNEYNPRTLRIKSIWRAPLPPLEIDSRFTRFSTHIEQTFKKQRVTSNLNAFQQTIMREIKSNKKIMIIPTDKVLGPVCVNTEQYITWGLQHLLDSTTYRIIPEETAIADATLLRKGILDWTR